MPLISRTFFLKQTQVHQVAPRNHDSPKGILERDGREGCIFTEKGGGDIIAVGKENFIRKKVGRVLRIQNNITGCFKFIQYLSTRPTFMVSALENRDLQRCMGGNIYIHPPPRFLYFRESWLKL